MLRSPETWRFQGFFFGGPGAIRTPDPQIRSLMLYPAELRDLNAVAESLRVVS
jgi:hypothetical protein